jgi:hypothetical protein
MSITSKHAVMDVNHLTYVETKTDNGGNTATAKGETAQVRLCRTLRGSFHPVFYFPGFMF